MNKTILTLSTLVIAGGAVFFAVSNTFAYRGDPTVQGPNYSPEKHEVMTQAFETNDYNLWVENMQGRGRITEVINEGNFERYSEMHKLMLEGKTEEANTIRTELGLGLQNGSGCGTGQGMRYGRIADR